MGQEGIPLLPRAGTSLCFPRYLCQPRCHCLPLALPAAQELHGLPLGHHVPYSVYGSENSGNHSWILICKANEDKAKVLEEETAFLLVSSLDLSSQSASLMHPFFWVFPRSRGAFPPLLLPLALSVPFCLPAPSSWPCTGAAGTTSITQRRQSPPCCSALGFPFQAPASAATWFLIPTSPSWISLWIAK